MKRVYICHPYTSDPEENKKKVEKIMDALVEINLKKWNDKNDNDHSDILLPVSVFHAFPPSMSESEKCSRDLVMLYCKELLLVCDACWVCINDGLSEGMMDEIEFCSENKIPIVFFKFINGIFRFCV